MPRKLLKVIVVLAVILGIVVVISNLLPEKVVPGTTKHISNEKQKGTIRHTEERKTSSDVYYDPDLDTYFSQKIKPNNTNKESGPNVKLLEKMEFSPEPKSLLKRAISFCVTEDEVFIITDYEASNIKVYEKSGSFLKLTKIIGEEGYGTGEFKKPAYCFYNTKEKKFGVMDFGTRKISIYKIKGKIEFELFKEIFCQKMGTDSQLKGNKLLISGYMPTPKKETYDLYYIDLIDNQPEFLLPSYCKYGLKSFNDYVTQYRRKPDIKAIGISSRLDIHRDDVYFVWEGDLRIIKINIGSREWTSFGEKTPSYIKPFASRRLLEGYSKGNPKVTRIEKTKMSFIRDIFVNPKYVMVIYEGPIMQDKSSNFRLQFYTLDGDFIKEVPISGKPDRKMWFDKDMNILYSLSSKLIEDVEHYFILKYEIY